MRVVVRSGDLVRLVPEHFADDDMLLSDAVQDAGLRDPVRPDAGPAEPSHRGQALSPLWSEVALVRAGAPVTEREADGR